jgi:hypothetical protein
MLPHIGGFRGVVPPGKHCGQRRGCCKHPSKEGGRPPPGGRAGAAHGPALGG